MGERTTLEARFEVVFEAGFAAGVEDAKLALSKAELEKTIAVILGLESESATA